MFRMVKRSFFQIVCDDCGESAGPLQETVEGALGDAIGEDFQNYGPGDGTGEGAVWRCPDCALAEELHIHNVELHIHNVVRLEGTANQVAVMSDGTRRPWADVYMDANIRAGRHPANPHIRITPVAGEGAGSEHGDGVCTSRPSPEPSR